MKIIESWKHFIHRKKQFTTFQIIIFGFLMVILAGSFMLMLPFATRDGKGASFLDAIFTATSATCVTGLAVQDTATYWSEFGQFIILIMIQIGGMGVVTLAVAVAVISGRKIGLMQRSTMQEAIAAPNVGGIVRMTSFIIKTSLIIEMLGAVAMFPVFYQEFGIGRGLWYSLFHSISAFCNAGFDLMGVKQPSSSLTFFESNPVINVVIILLILIGGIGFMTWEDIRENKFHIRKYRMQSKIILCMSAILIAMPTIFFFFHEFSTEKWDHLSLGAKIWGSLFQAVTPRTAGFNTVDLSQFSEAGQIFMLMLMLIGGAPGSTAGGIKMTTVAVLILTTFAVFKKREDTNCFGRRIPEDTVRYAAAILILYLVLFLSGSIFISCIEDLPILTCLFETGSAIATVGLSMGITSGLSVASKIVLIALMFMGRVGGLTLVFAAMAPKEPRISKLPQEKITVG